jgi:mRNA-degrading endonuclease RelE of RelBE toxin-antitoxin system
MAPGWIQGRPRASATTPRLVTEPYELGMAPPARRAISDRLAPDVAAAAVEFITGPLLANPYRVGKRLGEELRGILSARRARQWRVLYDVSEDSHTVIVLDIRHRAVAYRAH